jgi:hypothetical protein
MLKLIKQTVSGGTSKKDDSHIYVFDPKTGAAYVWVGVDKDTEKPSDEWLKLSPFEKEK